MFDWGLLMKWQVICSYILYDGSTFSPALSVGFYGSSYIEFQLTFRSTTEGLGAKIFILFRHTGSYHISSWLGLFIHEHIIFLSSWTHRLGVSHKPRYGPYFGSVRLTFAVCLFYSPLLHVSIFSICGVVGCCQRREL